MVSIVHNWLMGLSDLEEGRVYTAAELRAMRALPSVRRAETADIRDLVERAKQAASVPVEPKPEPAENADPFTAVPLDGPETGWR